MSAFPSCSPFPFLCLRWTQDGAPARTELVLDSPPIFEHATCSLSILRASPLVAAFGQPESDLCSASLSFALTDLLVDTEHPLSDARLEWNGISMKLAEATLEVGALPRFHVVRRAIVKCLMDSKAPDENAANAAMGSIWTAWVGSGGSPKVLLRRMRLTLEGRTVAQALVERRLSAEKAREFMASDEASRQATVEDLRGVVRSCLAQAARELTPAELSGVSVDRAAGRAVEELAASRSARELAEAGIALGRGISVRRGEFGERVAARDLLLGTIGAEEALAVSRKPAPAPTPRSTMLARLYSVLRAETPPDRCGELARDLERGCYNHAVDRCILSSESFSRSWESPMFVSIYSARCGMVLRNLERGGLVAQETADGGLPGALKQILDGKLDPVTLAERMSAAEICPEASQKVRDHIQRRREQKVKVRLSDMFTCPGCGAREHTSREVQIRGGDEATTTFCKCNQCHSTFTVG